jgi:hypothetical protein
MRANWVTLIWRGISFGYALGGVELGRR